MDHFAEIMKEAFEKKVSDVHFREGQAIYLRTGARMSKNLDYRIDLMQIPEIIFGTLNDKQQASLAKRLSLDYSYEVKGICRLRGNVFYQRRRLAATYRLIPL